ncbi:hypothetical protein ANCDUO_26857, partial [Ancylostoma duodenale]
DPFAPRQADLISFQWSTRVMITEKDVEVNCFTPRDYQVELLDKACKRNVIVQLGTGAGKTFIAVLLLKEYGLQIMSPFESGGKRAFFVVDKGTV